MAKKRIVITGMGLVSCHGNDVEQFYDRLLAGESGVKLIDQFPCEEYPTRIAAPISNFDAGDYLDKKQARRVDPFIAFGVVAGKRALESSRLPYKDLAASGLNLQRCGVLIGSGMGGMTTFSEGVETLTIKGFKRITPFFIPYIIPNMAGAVLAIDIGFMGPNYSVSTACATSNYAIHLAARHIRDGDADLMLCGGAEASVTPIGLAGFVQCKALSERNDQPTRASRPWDQGRDGFVLGEGSGVLVLESLEHALKRGAPIYAEYLGGGLSCDAYHMTDPREDGKGVALCIEAALEEAGIAKEEINYINAHATSTPGGDMREIEGLRKLFGSHLEKVAINATKSMIGHCLGAAGAIEAIAVIQAIRRGELHPTINQENPEPGVAGLDLVPNRSKRLRVKVALSNSFGFGGHNSCLIFAPYNG